MSKVRITEATLNEAIANTLHKYLNESLETERLNNLFAENKRWKRTNPSVPGNENPYPRRIRGVFLDYFFANYKLILSYSLPWKENRISYEITRAGVNDPLYHAVFDCETIDDCIYLLKYWVGSYYEEKIYERLNDDEEHEEELYEYDIKIAVDAVKK